MSCGAQEWVAIPDGGESMLPEDSLSALRTTGSASLITTERIAVSGMPFSQAIRVTIARAGAQAWEAQVLGRTSGDIRAGDVLLLAMFVRGSSTSHETGEAAATAYLQRSSGDFAKVISLPIRGAEQWKQFFAPVRVALNLPAGQHEFTIHIATGAQVFEIGGITLINYRDQRTIAELPKTQITWPGSEADAPWRVEAAERIDRLRKANLTVAVRNAAGQPVANARVRIRQQKHEFPFGSAVAADGLSAATADGDRYRETVRTWFNTVVLENDLKWPNWEANRNRALNALAWLRDNGIERVRGHTLVWPGWQRMPRDVEQMAADPERLRARVLSHIADITTATAGQLVEWDVVNEPYTNTDLQKILGESEMAAWFHKAREHDPLPTLYINDYAILSGGGLDRAHQDHYYATIGKLLEWGAPLGGIGMQGHFSAALTSTPRLWQILDRFASYGLPIQITEFDVDVDDEQVQAAYTRDFLTAIFAHPSVKGFLMWGFWEGRHWKPQAAMFRRDWSLKPNAEAYYDMVFQQWWTDETGSTSADGTHTIRGFKGRYLVEVQAGDKTATAPVTLDAAGAAVTITIQ